MYLGLRIRTIILITLKIQNVEWVLFIPLTLSHTTIYPTISIRLFHKIRGVEISTPLISGIWCLYGGVNVLISQCV